MSFHSILILICSLTFSYVQAATVAAEVDQNTASSVIKETDANGAVTSITIFGGYAGENGGCSPGNVSANPGVVCNSCSAINLSGGIYQCAQRSIYGDLLLKITVAFSEIPQSPNLIVQWATSSGTTTTLNPVSVSTSQFAANSGITVAIRWSDICTSALNYSCRSTPTVGGATGTLTVGLGDSSGTIAAASSQKFNVRISVANPADNTNLVIPTTSPTSDLGFTDFKVSPGDSKVFVSDIYRGGVGTSGTSGVKWSALRIYYATYSGSANFASITYGDNFSDLAVMDKTNVNTSLADNKVTGLTNDQTYMFTAATVDETSIVSGFLDPAKLNGLGEAEKARYLAQPGEVVGLLNDKKCFIATAAFGSSMAPQVELLRKFRNEFLIPNQWGRNFVHLYYKYSPPAAQFIAEHEVLRTMIRGALWPVIFLADFSLKFGFFLTFGLFAVSLLSLILLIRHLRRAV